MTDPRDAPIRRSIFYSGHVQGVGFRTTTLHIARGLNVTGLVRNLADGRVELVAEGLVGELDRFQKLIEDAMGRHIREAAIQETEGSGEFTAFRVAF